MGKRRERRFNRALATATFDGKAARLPGTEPV
jgi:hypothetical protein